MKKLNIYTVLIESHWYHRNNPKIRRGTEMDSTKYVCNDNYDTLATVHIYIDIIIA